MAEITGLLLAAGMSRRFGDQKLLADVNGRPMALHSAGALRDCYRVIAVIRASDIELQQILQAAGIETVINKDAELGMGNSIACGVRASPDCDGWCILPADMPGIASETVKRVSDTIRNGAMLTAPYYQGRRGHPVGFSKVLAEDLATLDGDTGARSILNAHPDRLVRIDTEDPGILIDIDTPQDLLGVFSPRQPP